MSSSSSSSQERPTQITPHVYLGGAKQAKNLSVLKSLGITHVLNCTPPKSEDPETGCPNYFEKDRSAGFVYKRIPVFDNIGEDLLVHLDGAIKFIEQSQHYGKVLVHCHKGISRSASIVMGYLMKTNELTLSEALEHLRGLRPVVSPNEAFMRQLAVFEESLTSTRTVEASQDSHALHTMHSKCAVEVMLPTKDFRGIDVAEGSGLDSKKSESEASMVVHADNVYGDRDPIEDKIGGIEEANESKRRRISTDDDQLVSSH